MTILASFCNSSMAAFLLKAMYRLQQRLASEIRHAISMNPSWRADRNRKVPAFIAAQSATVRSLMRFVRSSTSTVTRFIGPVSPFDDDDDDDNDDWQSIALKRCIIMVRNI
jgi:hypothetical protein